MNLLRDFVGYPFIFFDFPVVWDRFREIDPLLYTVQSPSVSQLFSSKESAECLTPQNALVVVPTVKQIASLKDFGLGLFCATLIDLYYHIGYCFL